MNNLKYTARRKDLVDELAKKGIQSDKVLQAIAKVPRHLLMDKTVIEFAYDDKAFPIAAGQTISQPYTVAYQSELLNIQKGDKVLEIGTGSGYQSAVLVELGAHVYSVERQKALFHHTYSVLPSLGYRIRMFYGDGYLGLPKYAPFDKIIVTASADSIPETLVQQLKIGGIMVVPVGTKMYKITRLTENETSTVDVHTCAFVPMLHGIV
ncbi:MAG: protein-L-isoaspartate(D-aspartate) O-methyltransferase [Paludibacteraceae bacterium]|nr:protein-L-isoaspartate(D-aspartate) O-methyltransferase [Paludibacteraceae bacterium]MBP6284998.1 protein-L-isoaspartate(D-aspartate) O-methyltransferase [Paludibacteraceae bacterium]